MACWTQDGLRTCSGHYVSSNGKGVVSDRCCHLPSTHPLPPVSDPQWEQQLKCHRELWALWKKLCLLWFDSGHLSCLEEGLCVSGCEGSVDFSQEEDEVQVFWGFENGTGKIQKMECGIQGAQPCGSLPLIVQGPWRGRCGCTEPLPFPGLPLNGLRPGSWNPCPRFVLLGSQVATLHMEQRDKPPPRLLHEP